MSTTTTGTAFHLPTAQEIRELLEGLLGRAVTVAPGPPLVPSPNRPVSVGLYVDDNHMPYGVSCFDLPLGAAAGASLGLMPPHKAEEAVAAGRLEGEIAENLGEVLNILAATLNAPGATHMKLRGIHHAGEPLPPAVLMRTLVLGRRVDLHVEVAGYGSGQMSFVLNV